MEELTQHSQNVHSPYSCNICFLCFSAEYKLLDHRQEEHDITSLGATVTVGNPSNQIPVSEDDGAANQVVPDIGNQGNQSQEQREPKVPTGGQAQQHEVDKLLGSEVLTGVFKIKCEACNHFLSSPTFRHNHIAKFYSKLLKQCPMCSR